VRVRTLLGGAIGGSDLSLRPAPGPKPNRLSRAIRDQPEDGERNNAAGGKIGLTHPQDGDSVTVRAAANGSGIPVVAKQSWSRSRTDGGEDRRR
jgi:hypothetical protein